MPSTARDWMLTISAEKHTRQDVEELLDILGHTSSSRRREARATTLIFRHSCNFRLPSIWGR